MAKKPKRIEPIHPGEILLEECELSVPPGRISAIVNGERAITADTALRLGAYFEVSAEIWVGLQADHELRVAKRTVGAEIAKRVRPHVA